MRLSVSAQVVSGVAQAELGSGQGAVVTLSCKGAGPNGNSVSYDIKTNQIITINSLTVPYGGTGWFTHYNGLSNSVAAADKYVGTGKITLATAQSYAGSLTFTVFTTPTNSVSIVPMGSVVIPTDATGPVQIVLESSSDLVNWIPSLPGTYGNTYSNRFFRVRAVAQQ